MQIFASGGLASAQMPFLLVFFKQLFDFIVKRLVYLPQILRYIFMYSALAYTKPCCGASNRGIVFKHVPCKLYTPLLTCRNVHHI